MKKDIIDFPNYEVSDEGKVYRKRDGYEITPRYNKKKYLTIDLSHNGKSKRITLHRLVAKAFIPCETTLQQVNHKDGNKENNHVSNLEWVTMDKNLQHAFQNNLITLAKLNDNQVMELINECSYFVTQQAIKYNIDRSTVKYILEKPNLLYRKFILKQ